KIALWYWELALKCIYVTKNRFDKNKDNGNNKSISKPTHHVDTLTASAASMMTNESTPAFTAFFMFSGELILYAFTNGVNIAKANSIKNGINASITSVVLVL